MKIDLHCHTKKIKSGDSQTRNVSLSKFSQKILDANVKIVAITNHNHFDYKQYNEFSEGVKNYCQLWPGIELDIQANGLKRWHLICVANPKYVRKFSELVTELVDKKDVNTCRFQINEIINKFSAVDAIYIAHFHKKPAISDEEIETVLKLIGDDSRFFHETQDKRSLGVFANHDYKVIVGSDVQNWDEYEQSSFAELRLQVSSFEQFCLLSKRDVNIVKTLLDQKKSYDIIAYPHINTKLKLKIYEEVNIVFGQKGTGKSEILKSLHQSLEGEGLTCKSYRGAEKEEEFNDLLKIDDLKRDVQLVNSELCCEEFQKIRRWSDLNPTLISSYFNWWSTKDNNAYKSRMQITNSNDLHLPNAKKYNEINSDYSNVNDITKKLGKINFSDYVSPETGTQINQGINLLNSGIKQKLFSSFIGIETVKLTNFSTNKIKNLADRNSETKSKPSNTGFLLFAVNRIELKSCILKILENIENKETNTTTFLGELEGKGKVYIKNLYRTLSAESKTTEFKIGIRTLNELKKTMKCVDSKCLSSELQESLSVLKELIEKSNINSTEHFLGLSKHIVNDQIENYTLSNGEKSIILLQRILNSQSDAYLLDEPELGMGNSYIDTIIRPKLSELGKNGKVVVVATHNANLAVRTLPYNSIFRVYEDGNYSTYIGNPFDNKLKNIYSFDDVKSWRFESMHTLEGGEEAFYERKNIYESGDN